MYLTSKVEAACGTELSSMWCLTLSPALLAQVSWTRGYLARLREFAVGVGSSSNCSLLNMLLGKKHFHHHTVSCFRYPELLQRKNNNNRPWHLPLCIVLELSGILSTVNSIFWKQQELSSIWDAFETLELGWQLLTTRYHALSGDNTLEMCKWTDLWFSLSLRNILIYTLVYICLSCREIL